MRALFLIFLLSTPLGICLGQVVNNGSTITVSPGGLLSINQDFQNNGELLNQGSILLRNNWTQNGKHKGNGSFTAAGTIPQTFTHNESGIGTLIINNAEGVLLRGKLVINNELDLIAGNIITSVTDTLLISPGGEVSRGSFDSYVVGPLHRAGLGEKYFPIGTANAFLPTRLLDVKGSNPTIMLEVKPDFGSGSSDLPEEVEGILPELYWSMNYQGTFDGSPIALPVFDDFIDRDLATIVAYNGGTSTSARKRVEFREGYYYNELVSLDDFYGEALVLAQLRPDNEEAFYIPNVLNPNAMDSDNQVIKVYGDVVSEGFLYIVYDRRGVEIFRTQDLEMMQENGWSGIYSSGKTVPAGAYVYAVQGVSSNGSPINQTGSVMIIR